MDTNSILLAVQDKIPKDIQSRQMLQDRLDKLSDSQRNELVQKLPLLKLKSPALVFWVGSFLFGALGVDRFYKGDIGLGVVKLLTCWLTLGIWWFIDLFLVWRGIKNDNVAKIAQALAFAKKK